MTKADLFRAERYRSRTVVSAMLYDGTDASALAIRDALPGKGLWLSEPLFAGEPVGLFLGSPKKNRQVHAGSFVVKHANGTLTVMTAESFGKEYELEAQVYETGVPR